MANQKLLSAMAVAVLMACVFAPCLMVFSDNGSDAAAATYGVTVVEGETYVYETSFNLEGVTVSVSGSAAEFTTVDGLTVTSVIPEYGENNAYVLNITGSKTKPTQSVTQTINFTVVDTLAVSGTEAANIAVGKAYTHAAPVSNIAGVVWSASNLPAGLSINASTGVISGTPTSADDVTATVTATHAVRDGKTQTDSFQIAFTASEKVQITSEAEVFAIRGTAVPTDVSNPDYWKAEANIAGVTFQASGLPEGITMAADGSITGTASVSGEYDVTVTVTETATGQTAQMTVTFTVVDPIGFTSVPTGGIEITPVE